MTGGRSKLFGAGVLGLIAAVGLWLGLAGERASAGPDPAPRVRTVSMADATPVQVAGRASTRLVFDETSEVVQRLAVYLNVESRDPRTLKVYLVSPTGTRVLVADGSTSAAARADRLEGWFGAAGVAPAEAFAAFSGERVTGEWTLDLESAHPALLKRWSLTADLGADGSRASMETYAEHRSTAGCDCNVSPARGAAALSLALLLLGAVVLGARTRRR